jgi:hypothetical protein
MRVKMLIPIAGVAESQYDGVQPGDIIDVALDSRAEFWISQKLAVAVAPDTPITGRRIKDAGGSDSRYVQHY